MSAGVGPIELVGAPGEDGQGAPSLARTVEALHRRFTAAFGAGTYYLEELLFCPDHIVKDAAIAGVNPARIVDATRKDRLAAIIRDQKGHRGQVSFFPQKNVCRKRHTCCREETLDHFRCASGAGQGGESCTTTGRRRAGCQKRKGSACRAGRCGRA